MRRSSGWMIAIAITAASLLPAAPITQAAPSPPVLPVMTENMDEGTDFGLLAGAATPAQFVAAVTATYQEVQASNIPERAAGVAAEIAVARPTLVALQEVSLWRTGPLGSTYPSATNIQLDQLQSVLSALNKLGLHYAPLCYGSACAVQPDLDVEAPSTLGYDVRLTDRVVVLARTDLPLSQFHVVNLQEQSFVATSQVPTPAGPVPSPRSWIAVDAQMQGTTYRFITTHLDSDPSVQVLQGNELLQGPASTTSMPLVIAADFNSAASGGPDPSTTYKNFINAGFGDAWSIAHPGDAGFTWPLHREDPYTFVLPPPLSERIDLVLVYNNVRVAGVQRVTLLTPSGLWPSDHMGVTAQLQLLGRVQ